MLDTIYIIGAGAIGKALAINLKLENKKVILVRASRDDIPESLIEINCLIKGEKIPGVQVKEVSLNKLKHLEGIVIITAKAYGNSAIASKLTGKTGSSPLVILQNGIGVEKSYIEAGFEEVYRCVLFATSQSQGNNEISYKPVAPSPVGDIKSNVTFLHDIVKAISTKGFVFIDVGNIEEIAWQKTIINCVFNSICPLINVDNGIFQRDAEVMQLAKEIINECLYIAKASGVDLVAEEIEERLLFISKSSDGQLISTLQDINHNRPTEIDSLNLEIASIAEKLGLAHYTTRTKMLGELIKLKSKIQKHNFPD